MLQQTRVDTVTSYFEKWMRRFPSLNELAVATEIDVLSLWEGLGYYGRARNILRVAKIVSTEYNGRFPSTIQELVQLPGIGSYTAGAIASIAFNADEPAVDANVKRVYARVYDIEDYIESTKVQTRIQTLIRNDLPSGRAGDFNQALMDFGTIICKPRKPSCNNCPIADKCLAKLGGVELERPVRQAKVFKPVRSFVAVVLNNEDKVLLLKHPSKGLLGGLWEIPNLNEDGVDNSSHKVLLGSYLKKMGVKGIGLTYFGEFKHSYTHFHQSMKVYTCKYVGGILKTSDFAWAPISEIHNYPMGKIFRMISRKLEKNEAP